jgi:protein-arginine kinase activator protein McsA
MGIKKKQKRCQKCRKKPAVRRVMEILDRFDYRYLDACEKCATEIEKETSQFAN